MHDKTNKNVRIAGRNGNTAAATGLVFNATYESQALLFETPGILQVSSSSANDAAAGTGARSVKISGFDAAGELIEETLAMNGQTAVPSTKQFASIMDVRIVTAGSGGVNAGNIFVAPSVTALTAGVPNGNTIITMIEIGYGTANQWQFKVPALHEASIAKLTVGAEALEHRLEVKRPGEGWNVLAQILVNTESPVVVPAPAVRFPPGSVFRLRYVDGAGSNIVNDVLQLNVLPR